MHADVTNVFPPDEDDVLNIFNSLRGICTRKAVCINVNEIFSYIHINNISHLKLALTVVLVGAFRSR